MGIADTCLMGGMVAFVQRRSSTGAAAEQAAVAGVGVQVERVQVLERRDVDPDQAVRTGATDVDDVRDWTGRSSSPGRDSPG